MKKISIAMMVLVSSNAFAAKAQSSYYERSASYKAEHSIVAENGVTSQSDELTEAILKKSAQVKVPTMLSVEAVGGLAGITFSGY